MLFSGEVDCDELGSSVHWNLVDVASIGKPIFAGSPLFLGSSLFLNIPGGTAR